MSVDTEHDKCVLWIYVLKCIYMCQSLTRSYSIVQYGCSFDWILQWHSIWSIELNEEISSEMRNNRYIALVFEFNDTFSHHLNFTIFLDCWTLPDPWEGSATAILSLLPFRTVRLCTKSSKRQKVESLCHLTKFL